MSKYKLQPGGVLDQETGANVPENPDNSDWRAYQAWLEQGGVPDPWMSDEELLNEARKTALRLIDDQAEAERQKFITPGAGQAMTYIRKEQEARAAIQNEAPIADDYPLLKASISGESDMPLQAVGSAEILAMAQEVIARADSWTSIAAHIESVRLSAKKQAQEADTVEGIISILEELDYVIAS